MIAQLASDSQKQGQQELAKRTEYRQPLIDQQKTFASGDRKAMIGAASPAFRAINDSFRQTSSNIKANLTGPERDFALSETDREKNNAVYSYLTQLFQAAPQNLAALGNENAQVGLSQINTGLSGFNSSADLTANMIQQENARRAVTLGFLGSLAGAGGSLAGAKWGKG